MKGWVSLLLAGIVLVPVLAVSKETTLKLTEGGKPCASIVVSERPTQAAVMAAVELRDHIKKSSGAELPIVTDTTDVRGLRVLVGESAATRALGLRNDDLKPQEYLIRYRDDTLILMGRDGSQPYGLKVSGSPEWCEGKDGKALCLDGVDDSLLVSIPLSFDDRRGSMELWMRPDQDAKGGTLLRLDGSPWTYHIVSYQEERIAYATYDGTREGSGTIKSDRLSPNWHHIRVTWDASCNRKEIIVDGKKAASSGYSPTHCAKANLQIGAMDHSGVRGSFFKGAIRGFRLADSPGDNASTLTEIHCDEGAGLPGITTRLDTLQMSRGLLPDPYDGEGTIYAVYHFLERFCGVRWYGPTEICTVIPSNPTLTVRVADVRRVPSMAWRCVMPVHNFGRLMAPVKGLWGNPTVDELWIYLHRMRNGGERFSCSHSFYGWYDRFWHKNPKNEKVWEEQHLEWFAHGYDGKPPQLCYSNDEVVKQVVSDAREFFEGRRRAGGAGNFFQLGAMDNSSFCKCLVCKRSAVNTEELKKIEGRHFSSGYNSDYWFGFCNKVARELRKTHPDRFLSVLTYSTYAQHPGFRLEPNIAPQIALAGNTFIEEPHDVVGRHIWGIYREWIRKEKGHRPIYLWLYPEFPESWVWSRGYTSFPGFGARLIGRQMKMYVRDGIRGIFPEGITTQLNEYMYNQMAFDAAQDADRIMDEFFTLYYGNAAAPMRKLWLEIEETYTNPANWPVDPENPERDITISEETSWKLMGTTERMTRWAGYMEDARAAASTESEKARVRLFEQWEWEPMVRAKQIYEEKSQYQTEVETLKQSPPPSGRIHKLAAPSNGDALKVDWSRGETIKLSRDVYGYPEPQRQAEAVLLHDGRYLYIRLMERMNTESLQVEQGIFNGDDWEIFMAAQREKPYRQIGINPRGNFHAIAYGEPTAWDHKVKVTSEVSPDVWTVYLCLPMANVVPGGLSSGQTLYLNIIRSTPGADAALTFSPHFVLNFHMPSRLASFSVE